MQPRPSSLLVIVLSALLLAACGSSNEGQIPRDESEQLLRSLDNMQNAIEADNCGGFNSAYLGFQDEVNDLGESNVDADIQAGLDRLSESLGNKLGECEELTEEEMTTTEETTSTSTATTTTEEPTTTTETTEETTTSETTTPDPPDDGGGDDGDGGGGIGPGGTPPGQGGTPPGDDG